MIVRWLLVAALAGSFAGGVADDAGAHRAAAAVRTTRWSAGEGTWDDAARWSAGVPDGLATALIQGPSDVRVPAAAAPLVTGMLRLGTLPGDRARLHVDGGALVLRREFLHAGEARDSQAEIALDRGALHAVSTVYLGGTGEAAVGSCRATLRIRGGSFVCRYLTIGWGQAAEATLEIDGSGADAVHVLDGVALGVPVAARLPSTSTLRFTLDARGVTPLTIASRRARLRMARVVPQTRCRLEIALRDVPPRDDVTLVAAQVAPLGEFDNLPEGAEIAATHAGREYRWTLTYRGGPRGADLALTRVRGHAAAAPVTACRPLPAAPTPLWESVPARTDAGPDDAPLAFEGAEGFGRHAAGGRGGRTIYVEHLGDAGPGSFRAAVEATGPRTVAFRVAGTIRLRQPLRIDEPFLTVDGGTAPGEGITLVGQGFLVTTHDVVLRHLRIRPGDDTEDTDALSFHDAERCLADHLSLGWGTDEVVSVAGLSDAITIQWCLIHEGLNRTGHGFASISGGERVTWHHNLMAHCVSRVPRFAGIARADFRNNVLYNWGHTAGYGQFERLNYVANYLKPGPSTRPTPPRFLQGDEVVGRGALYLEGNVVEGHDRVTADNWLGVGFEPEVRATAPFAAPPVQTDSAAAAYRRVLDEAGALPDRRDATDRRVVSEVRLGTGQIINSAADLAD